MPKARRAQLTRELRAFCHAVSLCQRQLARSLPQQGGRLRNPVPWPAETLAKSSSAVARHDSGRRHRWSRSGSTHHDIVHPRRRRIARSEPAADRLAWWRLRQSGLPVVHSARFKNAPAPSIRRHASLPLRRRPTLRKASSSDPRFPPLRRKRLTCVSGWHQTHTLKPAVP